MKEKEYEQTSNPRAPRVLTSNQSTYGWTHGSSHMYSREWPGTISIKGEALGHVKAHCPREVELQLRSLGLGDWVGEQGEAEY